MGKTQGIIMTDWIEHNGGERPEPKGALVDIELQGPIYKQNIHHNNVEADRYSWNYKGQPKHGHIIAYRISNE